MEYLIGWALLGGFALILWVVVRFAGGEREEPRATCGVDGCSGSSSKRTRARAVSEKT